MTTAERLRTYVGDRQVDTAAISSLFARYWEIGIFAVMMGVAFGMRLWGLGDRAIHHDEALHMIYAYHIFDLNKQITGDGIETIYEHVPFMHGPFKYFATAAMFRLFGDNDTTGRLVYAISGTILVGLPYFLRAYIGRYGAIIAALLLAFSPTLLYFGRFNRDDLLITTYTLGMVIVMWRYLQEQKEWFLYLVPALLTLGFMTMESTFITTALFLAYVDIYLANELVDQIRASRKLTPGQVMLAYAVLIPTAWLIAAFWPLLQDQRKRWSLDALPASGAFLVVMGTFALPQFAAAVQKIPLVPGLGDADVYDAADEHKLMMVVTFLFIGASAAVGLMWNRKVWAIGAAIFYIPFFLLYTTFFTNGGDIWNPTPGGHFWTGEGGFWTGIWGSLDYWLSQQLVRRGSQPDYYYFMTLPVYEFLPLLFALGGTLYYAFRGKVEDKLLSAAALLAIIVFIAIPDSWPLLGGFRLQAAFLIAIGATLLLTMDGFTKFLIFWSLGMLFGITVAGEKMPWLTVHIALPIALLAAKIMNDILTWAAPAVAPSGKGRAARKSAGKEQVSAPEEFSWRRMAPFAAATGLGVVATIVFIFGGLQSGISALAWLLALAALGIVVWVARNYDWRVAGQVAAVALFMSLFVFTARAGVSAAYDEGSPDGAPEEMLIYAQGSPKLDVVFEQIEKFGEESGRGRAQPVLIDNTENIWPWPWYFRDHTALSYTEFQEGYTVAPGSVILVSQANQAKLDPELLEDYQAPIPYAHMWWFPQDYLGLEVWPFIGDTLKGEYWDLWAKYFIDRELAGNAVGPNMLAYFPKEFEVPEEVINPPSQAGGQVLPPDSLTIVGGLGTEDGQFSQPADVAVDLEGNLFVVDTLNQRVQKFAPNGQFSVAVGGAGAGDGQFGDPFVEGSYDVHDGPWGIGLDPQGNVYVADTWNHRVQVFNNDLEFTRTFGAGDLFGPRDVVIDGDGNALVVDTGNKRIVKYSPTGELLDSFGVGGSEDGQFNEPTSISIAPSGDIYVADYWNQRVQHFSPEFAFIDQIEIESWGSQGVTDRAYLVALENGRVLISDPANGRVAVYEADGTELSSWRLTVGATRPVGLAVVENSRAILRTAVIADGLASNVVKVPLTQLLTPSPTPAGQ